MSKGKDIDRREFLAGAALAAGAVGTLAGGANAAEPAAPAVQGESQAPPLREVSGRVAYVTGAASGIGLGCARVLRDAGMKVVLGDIDEARLKEALTHFKPGDPDVHTVRHDVTDRDGWSRVLDEVDGKFGRLHLLINNAGVGLNARAVTGTIKDWEWGMGVNFWGAVHGVQAAIPRMRAHGEGSHLCTVGSISGMFPGSGNGIYSVSKAAVAMLMEELRVELRETNIGTSIVYPGFTATNIGRSETYRPESLRNATSAAQPAPPRPAGAPPGAGAAGAQMDPIECAKWILDGIRHNDLFIFTHPEWKRGTQAHCDAIMASFVDRPIPPARVPTDPYRSPVFVQEIEHRRRTPRRTI